MTRCGAKEKDTSARPFICKHCNKATFAKKKYLDQHVSRNCPVLKKKVGNPLRKNNSQLDSKGENNLAWPKSNKGSEDVDDLLDTDHEDLEDTRDDHIICKECGGNPFTKESFEKHREQTGHTGENIKLPPYLSV